MNWCADRRYFKRTEDDTGREGQCQRCPPVIVVVPDSTWELPFGCIWPYVDSFEVCGEFAPAKLDLG